MRISWLVAVLGCTATAFGANGGQAKTSVHRDRLAAAGPLETSTLPIDSSIHVYSATYTPSGHVLVAYSNSTADSERSLRLATMDDDGRNFRPLISTQLPAVEKGNGLRFMVFSDDKRVLLGDFVLECKRPLAECENVKIVPVEYPAEVTSGDGISHRWSEIIMAPDNIHIAWTTLLANYSAIVLVGDLRRSDSAYHVANTRIISTLDPFRTDPAHPDGVLPVPLLGGEVKQFVHGNSAISLVGAVTRDTPDSVIQDLATGKKVAVTNTPGYNETTIFSPDERLGLTMTTRFSKRTDPAILGLLPRPYPDSLNIGLSEIVYRHAVSGVRSGRQGAVGPALIDIKASETMPEYVGHDLGAKNDWVFRSPLSWHPSGKKGMWIEGQRGTGLTRVRIVRLAAYRPGPTVTHQPFPQRLAFSTADLSLIKSYAAVRYIDVKVYGRKNGYIHYRRSLGTIEKTYSNFSDDGKSVYSGTERTQINFAGQSTYVAHVDLKGPVPGSMNLKITFGPLAGPLPAEIVFAKDATGLPLSNGWADYGGTRIDVGSLLP